MSPTQRALASLRAAGFLVAIVEHWNPYAKIRQDLFGVFDLVAIRPDTPGTVYVQVTSRSNHAARRKKLEASPQVPVILTAGNHCWVMSFAKVAKTKTWESKIEALTLGGGTDDAAGADA